MFRFNPRSRCNNSSRCCYRAREHVNPARSRRIRHGGGSHPEMSSFPCSVGLARAHPLTKTQAMEPSRQTWSSYGPPYPLGRWSWQRCTGFLQFSEDKGQTNYIWDYIVTSLSSSGRGVIWRLQWGARRQWKSAKCWTSQKDFDGPILT